MKTTLNVERANCPTCFVETLEALRRVDGVRAVDGSITGGCIEIDHDDLTLDVLAASVRAHLHGVEMTTNELTMVSVDGITESTGCNHRKPTSAPTPLGGGR